MKGRLLTLGKYKDGCLETMHHWLAEAVSCSSTTHLFQLCHAVLGSLGSGMPWEQEQQQCVGWIIEGQGQMILVHFAVL